MVKLDLSVEVKTEVGIFNKKDNYPNVFELNIPELEPLLKDDQYVGVVVKVGNLEKKEVTKHTSITTHKTSCNDIASSIKATNVNLIGK